MSARNSRRTFAAAVALLISFPAGAATTCSLAMGNIAFSYDVASLSAATSDLAVTVTCARDGGTSSVLVSVTVGPSAVSSTTANRQMRKNNGTELLAYNLYRDAARTLVWGNVKGIDDEEQTLSVPNRGTAQWNTTIYGAIPPGQDVSVGSYSDSLFVTVTP